MTYCCLYPQPWDLFVWFDLTGFVVICSGHILQSIILGRLWYLQMMLSSNTKHTFSEANE